MTPLARQEDPSQRLLVSSLEAILENLTEAVTVADGMGRVILRNRAAREMLGIAPRDDGSVEPGFQVVLRYPDGSAVPRDEYPIARALRGEPVHGLELFVERPGGSTLIVQFSGSVLRDGDSPALIVMTYRDVTEARRAAEQKHDYLRATSHDFRNPLSTLLAQAQVLEMETRRKGLRDENKAAQLILKSGRRMDAMLNDFIESMKFDVGLWSMRPRATDLNKLLREVAGRYQSSADCERVSLHLTSGECWAMVDPHQVERCLENILSNAFQHSPPESRVDVSLDVIGGFAEIAVKDRGTGIDPKHLPRIFDRFYRGGSGHSRGLGLGLYIVKLITEAHGGNVSVVSEPGKGSTFILTLPLRQASQAGS